MPNFNVGDRVRLKDSQEEGYIVAFLDANTLEVEIEDGFRLPFRISDLVPVSRDEDYYFRKAEITPPDKKKVELYAETGLFWAFVPTNEYLFDVLFLNNTDLKLAVMAAEDDGQIVKGLACQIVEKRSYLKIAQYNGHKFEQWPALIAQVLYFYERRQSPRPPLVSKIRFKAQPFHKAKGTAPLINKTAHLFSLDSNQHLHQQEQIDIPDPQKLCEALFTPNAPQVKVKPSASLAPKVREIDLHIEKILPDFEKYNTKEYLDFQVKAFEKELDKAIVDGCDEVIFIHGVGNGVLRDEVHRRLGKHPNVAFFQDARREKFGYGATLAKLK